MLANAVRFTRKRCRRLVVVMVGAAVLVTAAAPAGAAVNAPTPQGGRGEAQVQCGMGGLVINPKVTAAGVTTSGYVAIRPWVYSYSTGQWTAYDWIVAQAKPGGYDTAFSTGRQAGYHYVYMQYAWWLGDHWVSAGEFVPDTQGSSNGWCQVF